MRYNKQVWAILTMLTVWCICNSVKINTHVETTQDEIDAVTERLLEKVIARDSVAETIEETETEHVSFEDTFSAMRNQYGSGHVFTWEGKEYTTDYANDMFDNFSNETISNWVRNADDLDDYCKTNDRDECGTCGGDGKPVWYADRDADGLGDISTKIESCEQPEWASSYSAK